MNKYLDLETKEELWIDNDHTCPVIPGFFIRNSTPNKQEEYLVEKLLM
jgi:hypothetical protein